MPALVSELAQLEHNLLENANALHSPFAELEPVEPRAFAQKSRLVDRLPRGQDLAMVSQCTGRTTHANSNHRCIVSQSQ